RTLERLSTGFKINRASDGPASLVISERLKSQVASLKQAVDTTERAHDMVSTADAALTEINALLVSIQDLIIESANDGALSQEEVLANQFQVDSAVETINRIAQTTSFAGLNLLNGNFDYVVSGFDYTTISDHSIYGAQITNGVSQIAVNIKVTSNAQRGIVSVATANVGSRNNSGLSLLVSGNKGSELIVLGPEASSLDITSAVHALVYATGVDATISGANLVFRSVDYGSDQFVSVRDVTRQNIGNELLDSRDYGKDVDALINGIAAAARGLKISTNTFQLNASFTLSADFFTDNNTGSGTSAVSTLIITSGGATFQLGDDSNIRDQEFIGIQRITADNLGDGSLGFLNQIMTGQDYQLLSNPEHAHKIVDAAIDDISNLRARLGAFAAHTLETNVTSLHTAILSLENSLSRIIDTDFASETAQFTRNQILVQASTSILAQANTTAQSVLQLLQ
ncbi:MAG: flagellin, partial [Planctomycetota bacterium]